MIDRYYQKLIIGGLIWGVLFFLSRNVFLGVSFLMICISLAGFFVAYVGLLYAPWKTPWIISVVNVLKILTLVGLCLIAISFVIIEVKIWRGNKMKTKNDTQCLVVLGAGVYGTRPSASLRSRMDAAIQYLNKNPKVFAILSGGQGVGEDISEAEAMRRYLVEHGIAEDRLILEDRSTDTVENLTYSFAIAKEKGFAELAVVTNDFHMYRSSRLASKMGYEVGSIPAPVPKQGLFPISCYLREYCSVLLMYLREVL